jgi:phenylacetate-CoA ligase
MGVAGLGENGPRVTFWNADAETLPRERLEALALERMRETLARAGESAAWRRRLGGVGGDDVKTLDDWRRLPFLTKDELRDAYPFGLACGRERGYRRIQMSSGTTGNPILNPYTPGDVEQWGEVMARCYAAAGVSAADVIQITPSFGLFTGGFGFHYGAERLGAMVVPIGAGRTLLQLKLMRDLRATVLTAIATYPLRLMEVAREEGFDLRSLALRVGILGSEMWTDELRAVIERELSLRTFDIIGMTETGGPGLGIDCQARAGVHVWEDHYHVEIVDPRSGDVVPDGREGELVVSTLTREGLPLVRYRTRDLTRVVSRERCDCGRTALRIDRLRGRADDMVVFKGVNFYPRQIEAILMRQPGFGHEYRIVLDTDGGAERMTILVERGPGHEAVASARVSRELHDLLSLSPEIRLCAAGELERPQGKAVRVVDRRGTSSEMGGLATGPPSPPMLGAPRETRDAPRNSPTGPCR